MFIRTIEDGVKVVVTRRYFVPIINPVLPFMELSDSCVPNKSKRSLNPVVISTLKRSFLKTLWFLRCNRLIESNSILRKAMRILTLIDRCGCISPGIQIASQDTDTSVGDIPGSIDTGDTTDPEDTDPDDTDTDDTDTDDPDTDDTDTDDPDTDDTDDTDDMNSDLEPDANYGLPFARSTYLIFDGSMILGSSHSLTGHLTPFSKISKVDADHWGFAVSIYPCTTIRRIKR